MTKNQAITKAAEYGLSHISKHPFAAQKANAAFIYMEMDINAGKDPQRAYNHFVCTVDDLK